MFLDISICLGEAILNKLKESDPNKVIEINSNNGSTLTVEKARIQTITIARNLMGIDVNREDVVVIYSKANEKITPITFACLTIGAPIYFIKTNLENSIICERIQLLNPKIILYESEYAVKLFKALRGVWPKNLKHLICIDSVILHHRLDEEENFQLPDIGDANDNSAVLMITTKSNGSTIVKKRSHAKLAREFYTFRQITSESRLFFPNQHQFINQTLVLLMVPVFFGTQRIYSLDIEVENGSEKILEIIDTFKISHYFNALTSFVETLKTVEQTKNRQQV
ncbi:uncharacterized protein LOC129919727 [Episyrphus balteatus]|uniref:uncharacterized protein LOC129919727 n=1 Tax=Episyrphus balteatus TaxID=286459 RepID=UPI00248644CB|nr:uncharacterized protein LOC129919727 [Episyrphus balteatus]